MALLPRFLAGLLEPAEQGWPLPYDLDLFVGLEDDPGRRLLLRVDMESDLAAVLPLFHVNIKRTVEAVALQLDEVTGCYLVGWLDHWGASASARNSCSSS